MFKSAVEQREITAVLDSGYGEILVEEELFREVGVNIISSQATKPSSLTLSQISSIDA